MPAELRIEPAGPDVRPAVEAILRSVPDWFGIESATRRYIDDAARLPTWLACAGRDAQGFITLNQHYPRAAEIHCMAVRRDAHGRGVGTALIRAAETTLRARGVEYLQVKTQGPSRPSPEYARTTRFYEHCGFVPLEEVRGLWPGLPTLILVKRL